MPADDTTNVPAASVPSGHVPGPQLVAPVPEATKRSFRSKDAIVKKSFASGPSATGLPQILDGLNNFGLFEIQQLTTNTYVPNTISMHAVLFMLCNNLISNDKFLKSVRLWHPLTVFLFYSATYYIQILRVHRQAGIITTYHLTLLQYLEESFPFKNVPIPGPLVPFFSALSVSAAPYEWFGDVCPRLPNLTDVDENENYLLRNHTSLSTEYLNFANPLVFIDAIYRFAKGSVTLGTASNNAPVLWPADHYGITQPLPPAAITAHDGDKAPFPFAFFSAIFTDRSTHNGNGNIQDVTIDENDTRRFFFNTPAAKLPVPESKRINDQFFSAISQQVGYYSVLLQAAAPGPPVAQAVNMTLMQSQINRFVLDLPARPLVGTGTEDLLLEHLIGLVDVPDANGRSNEIHNWFAQLIPDMTMFCRYIEDSRSLVDINLVGLGCGHLIWYPRADTRLYLNDPISNAVQGAEMFISRQARTNIDHFRILGKTSDPTLESVATRTSALAATNINYAIIGGNANADQTAQRTGPFWSQPYMASTPVFDLAPYLNSEIGRYILPVAK